MERVAVRYEQFEAPNCQNTLQSTLSLTTLNTPDISVKIRKAYLRLRRTATAMPPNLIAIIPANILLMNCDLTAGVDLSPSRGYHPEAYKVTTETPVEGLPPPANNTTCPDKWSILTGIGIG